MEKSLTLFQFHKGTIKTAGNAEGLMSADNFNSIKVRLKRTPTDEHTPPTVISIP